MDERKFMRWQVGGVRITRVAELGGAPFPGAFMFPEATPELVRRHIWLRPHFAHEDGRLFGSIHSFVIESGKRRIIVDTCVGNDKPRSIVAAAAGLRQGGASKVRSIPAGRSPAKQTVGMPHSA